MTPILPLFVPLVGQHAGQVDARSRAASDVIPVSDSTTIIQSDAILENSENLVKQRLFPYLQLW